MESAERFFEYVKNQAKLEGREATIVHNVIKFVWSRNNWGIGYQSHTLLEMLSGLNLTEAEIIHFLQDQNGTPAAHKEF